MPGGNIVAGGQPWFGRSAVAGRYLTWVTLSPRGGKWYRLAGWALSAWEHLPRLWNSTLIRKRDGTSRARRLLGSVLMIDRPTYPPVGDRYRIPCPDYDPSDSKNYNNLGP